MLNIVGPTASGKSAAALAVARRFDGVIINADSMQVYRDLRILSARPSPQDEAAAPHRLYGVIDGAELCSAALWRDLATAEIEDALTQGRLPILCGGTGLYLKALMQGLSPIPDIPDAIRQTVRAEQERDGPEAQHRALAEVDPATAATLNATDSQRVARALEVWRATGVGLTEWRAWEAAERGSRGDARYDFQTLLFLPSRETLYAGIDARFAAMVGQGALEEVAALVARGLDPKLPVMKALGVPELAAALAGEIFLESAIETASMKSRRYAKRQSTWFRRQIMTHLLINETYSERMNEKIFSFIRDKLLTP